MRLNYNFKVIYNLKKGSSGKRSNAYFTVLLFSIFMFISNTSNAQCTVVTPDYFEDFSTFLNPCWEQATGNSTAPTNFGSSSWDSSTFPNTGSESTRNNMWTNTEAQWLISESIDLGSTTAYQLELHIAATEFSSNSSTSFGVEDEVGVMISSDDGASWTSLGVYTEGSTPSNTGQFDAYDLSSFTGVVKFGIYAIASPDGSSDHDVFLNSITVQEIPTCFRPQNLTVSNVAETTADIAWDTEATATSGYDYVVITDGTTPNASTTPTASVTSGVMSATLTGLTPNTDYEVYVRSNCGGGDLSAWSALTAFKTECGPISNINEDFLNDDFSDDLPDCWRVINETDDDFSQIRVTSLENFRLPNAVEMSNASATSGDMIVITPQLNNIGDGTHWLRFEALSTDVDNLIIGTMSDPNDASTFAAVETIDLTEDLESYAIDFASYTGTDSYIAFKRELNTAFSQVYFDDVIWEEAPSCIAPTNVSISNITTSTADLSWDAALFGESGGYEYVLITDGSIPDASTTASGSVTTGNTSANLTGLGTDEEYEVYVRTLCDAGEKSEWSSMISFTTACESVSLFNENFDSIAAGEMPDCWNIINETNNSSSIGVSDSDDFTRPFAVKMSNGFADSGDMIAIAPPVDNLGGSLHWLRLDVITNDSSNDLTIGTMSNPNDASTFTAFETLNLTSTSLESFIIDFTLYTGTDSYIAIKRDLDAFDSNVYFDNVIWEEAPSCIAPKGISVESPYGNAADFSWNAASNESNGYEWVIMEDGVEPDTGTAIETGTVDTDILTASTTGLTEDTDYDLYIKNRLWRNRWKKRLV